MSLERTPPSAMPPPVIPQPSFAPINIEPSACQICNLTMSEGQDCLIINECSHPFHRLCIEEHLISSAECPVCKCLCQLNELRSLVIQQRNVNVGKPSYRGKGRGAVAKHYNTRSRSRNLFQDPQNPQYNLNSSLQVINFGIPNQSTMSQNQQNQQNMNSPGQSTSNQMVTTTIDD